MKINEVLKKLRKIAGYTQNEMATMLEISQPYLAKIENNSDCTITLELLDKFANVLKIPTSKILEMRYLDSNILEYKILKRVLDVFEKKDLD